MKIFLVLSLLSISCIYATEKYTTENDDLDIEAVVANLDQLKAFVNCFLDKEECNSVAGDFKKDLPEAVQTACVKCTEAQKHIFNKFLAGLKAKLPNDYDQFVKKYDPEGNLFGPLQNAVANS